MRSQLWETATLLKGCRGKEAPEHKRLPPLLSVTGMCPSLLHKAQQQESGGRQSTCLRGLSQPAAWKTNGCANGAHMETRTLAQNSSDFLRLLTVTQLHSQGAQQALRVLWCLPSCCP